jgi:hypothetical protein
VSGLLGGLAVLTDHLPGTAAGSLVGALGVGGQAGGAPGVLTVLPGSTALAALVTYFIAFNAATLLLLRRRDLT